MEFRLEFQGIRCFPEKQGAALRPITLLVGENSSGKSTFLALCQVASSIVSSPFQGPSISSSFNEPPFLLGAYDQIASYLGGRAGRAKSFSVTLRADGDPKRSGFIQAEFRQKNGQPVLHAWKFTQGDLTLEAGSTGDPEKTTMVLQTRQGPLEPGGIFRFDRNNILHTPPELWRHFFPKLQGAALMSELKSLGQVFRNIAAVFESHPYAFAPIRTSPSRTYDPVSEAPEPEGSHVPMMLSRLARSSSEPQWVALQENLSTFGSSSGLFDEIEVIRKGKKVSDPFQIGVKTGGPLVNLVDVGYGVSQVLPILVDTLQGPHNRTFLLQQPEVHLHPRAQAELGSFFARQAKARRRFVVETHSDHLVDRIRMEIRNKKLEPKDVSLLYFERTEHGSTIHNIDLDERGEIQNPPIGYRQFFLNEEQKLLES